jgi:2-dehydropantoate 2-reductase
MHVLLVGPGALGCLLASAISRGTKDTDIRLSLLDHNRSRAEFIQQRGILYDLNDERRLVPLAVTTEPLALGPVDVIVLCVKSYDVPASLTSCRPLLQEGTLLLFMQNGIAHLDCGHLTGRATVAFGTTTEGATLLDQGHVRHAGSGATHLGFLTPPRAHDSKLLEKTAELFRQGGLIASITEDIMTRLWAKLFINVGINALTATLGCTNGDLLHLPGIRSRMEAAVAEAETVARAQGILIQNDPFAATIKVCEKTAKNISSMLQDVRQQRRTEIDAINGAVLKRGQDLGIATPENLRLVRQIKDIEAGYSRVPVREPR